MWNCVDIGLSGWYIVVAGTAVCVGLISLTSGVRLIPWQPILTTGDNMLLLLIILILVFGFGGYRLGPGIGYYGGGGLSLILIIILVLLVLRIL
jgi:hypothetical protein